MIGDVNLFLKGSPEEEDFEVEVEIMIAGERITHSLHTSTPHNGRINAGLFTIADAAFARIQSQRSADADARRLHCS